MNFCLLEAMYSFTPLFKTKMLQRNNSAFMSKELRESMVIRSKLKKKKLTKTGPVKVGVNIIITNQLFIYEHFFFIVLG